MNPLDRIEQLTKELARVTAERDDWKVRAESGTPAKHPLQSIVSNPEPSLPVDVGTIIDGTFGPATLDHIRDAAKMVSPAKHPDTEPVRRFRIGLCQKCGEFLEHGHECDAARKEGGAA